MKAFAMQQTSLPTSTSTNCATADDRRRRIRDLNDQARQAWGVYPHTQTVLTTGILALDIATLKSVIERVQNFTDFTSDNDPHGEHDFGNFEIGGQRYFWKFDYYTPDMKHGSPDPADPMRTVRALTVMLASEY